MGQNENLDVGFISQKGYGLANFTTSYSWVKPRLSLPDFMKYKAIIDIDGNSWSSRFGNLLCTNSVIIKVEPVWVQHFYKELVPWVHYVPANLSNLEEVVKYVVDEPNDNQIRNIVKNANAWCRERITFHALARDMLWTMVAYVEVMDRSGYKEVWKTQATENGSHAENVSVQSSRRSRLL